MITIDHFYVTVTNLDEAIRFYEQVLQQKIAHREGDRWADFDVGHGVYFGIYNATVDNEAFSAGNSPTLCLKTSNLEQERARIHAIHPKTISEIVRLDQPQPYSYFQFDDQWDNHWEVAQYNY